MVDVWLPYGGTEVCVRIPTENLQDIIDVRESRGVENPADEIRGAIKNPIDSERLADTVKIGDKVALALNIFDAAIAKLVVSLIIEEVAQSGLGSNDITVILAFDPFRSKRDYLTNQIKNEISSLGVSVVIHNPLGEGTYIGDTESGVKIYLNKAFAESRIKIVSSVIEPNPYAMYNWGGYEIALGLSGMKTIGEILAPNLNLNDLASSVHESLIGVSRKIEGIFSVSIIRNMRGEVIKAFAGDLEKSFYEGAKIIDTMYKTQVEKRADIIFISPGGSPLDANIFDSYGCLENALKILRGRGMITLVAECFEGYGNMEFYETISRFKNDLGSLEKSLKRRFSIGGFLAYRFLRALKRAEISMVSVIPDYYASEIPGLRMFRIANEALNYALKEYGRKAKVSVIPHGNHIIPVLKEVENNP